MGRRSGAGPGAKARRGGATPRRFPLGAVADPAGSGGSSLGSVERRRIPPKGGGGGQWRIPPGRAAMVLPHNPSATNPARVGCATQDPSDEVDWVKQRFRQGAHRRWAKHYAGVPAATMATQGRTRRPRRPPWQHGTGSSATTLMAGDEVRRDLLLLTRYGGSAAD
jgi:hypothetical protein